MEITSGLEEEEEEEEEEENIRVVNEVTTNKEINAPESPPTDRGSVRSSGYGSKETDSVSEGSSGHDEDDLLGNEIDASLKPPPAPSPFRDNRKELVTVVTQVEVNKSNSQNGQKDNKLSSSSLSVAQLRKTFETTNNSETTLPAVISKGGKPLATIVTQHPQFVKAIEVGMRRTKSLETVQQQRVMHDSGSSTIPRPVWPKVGSLYENVQRKSNKEETPKRLRHSVSVDNNLNSHERTPSPVDIVKQDVRYVTSINVTPKRSLIRAKTFSQGQPKEEKRSANNHFAEFPRASTLTKDIRFNHDYRSDSDVSRYFSGGKQSASSFNLISLQPDSLVNEDTLRMMRYGKQDDLLEEENEPPVHPVSRVAAAPLPDFSQVMYTRGLYATLNRAASLSTKDIVKPPYKTRSRSIDISIPYQRNSAKKKGLSSIKGLWEKSGLKTNGRKLIVDVNDLLDDSSLDGNDRDSSSVENLRSFQSTTMANAMKSTQPQSSSASPHHYEEPINYNHRYTSHPVSGTMESRFSDTYAEIDDITMAGIDNPAFLDDSGNQHHFSLGYPSHFSKKPRFLDPDKLAEFQKKISEKLQGAPHHRTQWLDLDEIVIEGAEDKHERRVKFTSDTINPGSLERKERGSHLQGRTAMPGGAVRAVHEADIRSLSGRQLPELTLEPSHLMGDIKGHKSFWTSTESYRDRFQVNDL